VNFLPFDFIHTFDRWNEIVKDKILAAAMVDRLTHKAFMVNMNGQSYRLKETQKLMNYQTKQLC
jgi:DNA replication protein DnaC